MYITETATGRRVEVFIAPLTKADLAIISKKRFSFNWRLEMKHEVYKLCNKEDKTILGLMSLIQIEEEYRIEIKLLAVEDESKGAAKIYDRIAGILIAFACDMAQKTFGKSAAVSLMPKTVLRNHYINKYGFQPAGYQLVLEYFAMLSILKKYYYDK